MRTNNYNPTRSLNPYISNESSFALNRRDQVVPGNQYRYPQTTNEMSPNLDMESNSDSDIQSNFSQNDQGLKQKHFASVYEPEKKEGEKIKTQIKIKHGHRCRNHLKKGTVSGILCAVCFLIARLGLNQVRHICDTHVLGKISGELGSGVIGGNTALDLSSGESDSGESGLQIRRNSTNTSGQQTWCKSVGTYI